MTLDATTAFHYTLAANVAAKIASGDDTRRLLEHLLELGVQVVDGKLDALLDVPAALDAAIEALHSVHAMLGALPNGGRRGLGRLLASHAERRRQLDFAELDKLATAVASAESPASVGRSVVIAALVLLSNLASDERWFDLLCTPHHAA